MMRIGELLSHIDGAAVRPDPPRQETERASSRGGDPSLYGLSRARLEALLPTSGIVLGPPEADDRLEISPLAHALLRAGDEMEGAESRRVGRLHVAYLENAWEPDASQIALRLIRTSADALTETAFAESALP